MANTIILKKSSVAGKVPVAGDLQVGELAINLADAKLYSKNSAGTVIPVGGGGGGGGASVSIGTTPPGAPAVGDLWWNSESGVLFVWYNDGNSSQWVSMLVGAQGQQGDPGAPGGVQMVITTGDSITSTSLVNITGLSATLTPGTWGFDINIGGASSSNAGARFSVGFDGTVASIDYMQTGQTNTTGTAATTRQTTNNSTGGSAMGTTSNAAITCNMFGEIEVTSTGTFSARALKVTSGTLTVYNGIMTFFKVA